MTLSHPSALLLAALASAGDGASPATLRALYGLPPTAALDPARTALVLVDFQREFLDGGLPLPDAAPAVDRAARLLAWARAGGVAVVFVRQVAARPGPLFAPDSPGARPIPGLEPRDGDLVVTKSAAGGFTGTDLDDRLKARGIERLVIAGFMTHLAVDSTARDATVRGYGVVVAADATATRALPDPAGTATIDHRTLQRAALASLADRFAEVRTVAQIVALPLERPVPGHP
jgi:nicotinamidase-related amidase